MERRGRQAAAADDRHVRSRLSGVVVVGLLASLGGAAAGAQSKTEQEAAVENPFPDRPKVPEGILDGGVEWLNASGPIGIRDLKGKIVIFDFWTYCCINCMHVLPDLKFLEKKYPNELVVIGVHSAKFDNEKDSANIRQAILRYEIEHPVVNDAEMLIWRKFGVSAWPTLALVDPEGRYCGSISGEGHRELFDVLIQKLIAYHKAKGTLDQTPLRFDLERNRRKAAPLCYPGKVLADEAEGRLFIADSNHNRIVIATLDGQLIDVVGNGARGATDGPYEEAQFDHPQGLALVGQTLYVADTENHLIRAVDVRARTVSTLAGTGQQARRRTAGGALRETALNSPWDLAHVDGVLFIAMAGSHQVWSHRLGSESIGVFAGTGREDILDGPREAAALAQPSGLASDGKFLYVVDSEGSAVRRMSLDNEGLVTTIVGAADLPAGRALFEFGDVDGSGVKVRLQHPLGIACRDGILYVADSYNHKIKRIDVARGSCTTWIGDGKAGDRVDPPRLSEPGGVALAGDRLYIADTNNHRIAAVELATGKLAVLDIAGLEPPAPPPSTDNEFAAAPERTEIGRQAIAAGATLEIAVSVTLPEDYKLNELGPVLFRVGAVGEQKLIAADQLDKRNRGRIVDGKLVVVLPLAATQGTATLDVDASFTYCRHGTGGVCKLRTGSWRIPVALTESAAEKSLQLKLVVE